MAYVNGRWEPDIPPPPAPRAGPTPQPPAPPSAPPPPNAPPPPPAQPPPPPPAGGAQWTPDQIRQHFMSQASSTSGTGFNDTFNNIDNNTMQTWMDKGLWDQQNKRWLPEDERSRGRVNYANQTDFKPTDCPAGETPLGTNGPCTPNNQFDPNTGAFIGPGGANRGAGGQGGRGAAQPQGFAQSSLDEMTNYWKGLTKNSGSRYTPEAMAALEADQFARARAQEKNQLEDARADMATRGVSRSANQNAAMRDIRGGTGQAIMQNRAQIQRAKIDADFQDKQAAIKNAQDWVNSMRDYMLRTDMNAIQREQISAQIRLAQQNIVAQKQMMEQQYANNLNTYLLTGG